MTDCTHKWIHRPEQGRASTNIYRCSECGAWGSRRMPTYGPVPPILPMKGNFTPCPPEADQAWPERYCSPDNLDEHPDSMYSQARTKEDTRDED